MTRPGPELPSVAQNDDKLVHPVEIDEGDSRTESILCGFHPEHGSKPGYIVIWSGPPQ
jgi:hypothetical protein